MHVQLLVVHLEPTLYMVHGVGVWHVLVRAALAVLLEHLLVSSVAFCSSKSLTLSGLMENPISSQQTS